MTLSDILYAPEPNSGAAVNSGVHQKHTDACCIVVHRLAGTSNLL